MKEKRKGRGSKKKKTRRGRKKKEKRKEKREINPWMSNLATTWANWIRTKIGLASLHGEVMGSI